MTFVKRERHHVLQQHLGATPPLILGFHPSKRHAALFVFLRSGQHCSCLYLGITRTEAFLMASSASYLDVRSMSISRSIMLSLFYHLRTSCFLYVFVLDLKLVLIVEDQLHRVNTLLLFYLVDLICCGWFLFYKD